MSRTETASALLRSWLRGNSPTSRTALWGDSGKRAYDFDVGSDDSFNIGGVQWAEPTDTAQRQAALRSLLDLARTAEDQEAIDAVVAGESRYTAVPASDEDEEAIGSALRHEIDRHDLTALRGGASVLLVERSVPERIGELHRRAGG